MLKLGFLASNSGTSMRAIVGAIGSGALKAEARLVVSNKKDAAALAFAAQSGVPSRFIPTVKDSEAADAKLLNALTEAGVDLLVLSGYLRKLGPATLGAYAGRILNIHPALLPEFGGEGMYGRRVHEAVIAAGAEKSGCTIHLVDGEYDHGAIIARREIPIRQGDTAETLEARITAAEPAFFVETLTAIAEGRLKL
ncbi:MAG: phosphoribosylglycinamide formyltransferase [Caulobacteraceae bacterium]